MTDAPLPRGRLLTLIVARFGLMFIIMGLMFFLPAGSLRYWQGWLWIGTLLVPMLFTLRYLLLHDPALLERRMRLREREQTQKRVQQFGWLYLLVTFMLPGFDYRFGWSHVPTGVVLAAAAVMLLSYGRFVLVLRENSYASRVVEVAQGQKVIQSGPYAIVRHPMYVAVFGIYLASPLVLGSYWALIPAALIVPIIIMRILNEERMLREELPGYAEYTRKVRHRLLPGIW